MKKFISALLVVTMLAVSAISSFAGGRGGHRGGGGLSALSILGITAGALLLGGAIANTANQPPPVQYVPVEPQYVPEPMQYQQVPVQPPMYRRGTCFPQGMYFPDGVNIMNLGYFPPGTQVTPGYCFR